MISIPGKLRIMVDKNIRYGNGKFPIYFGMEDNRKEIHNLKDIIFEENADPGCMSDNYLFVDNECCQMVIDDLYRIGFRPSDEIKKDDLINTLKKEVEKRDLLISKLLDQYCLKGENAVGRKIIT